MATQTFGLSGAIVNSNKTYSSTNADVTALLQWGSTAYQAPQQKFAKDNNVAAVPTSVAKTGATMLVFDTP